METQLNFVVAQGSYRLLEMNLPLVEVNVELMTKFIGNCAGCDGAEHLAVLTGLDFDQQRELADTLRELGHGVELMRFAFGTALAQRFDATLIAHAERDREAARKEIISRVTRGHFDVVR